MSNKGVIQFATLFVKLSKEYNACLNPKDEAKRNKIKKKLFTMLAFVDSANNAEEILHAIFEISDKYAIMWVSKFKFKNELCIEIVKEELRKIKIQKRRINFTTIWDRLIRKNEKKS